MESAPVCRHAACLKSKAPRLRDWNSKVMMVCRCPSSWTWNQKHLDYEIETVRSPYRMAIRLTTWNQKYLDYEIETRVKLGAEYHRTNLKSKESRLRDWNVSVERTVGENLWRLKSKESRLRDWNKMRVGGQTVMQLAWNQKNLDYEIETEGWHALTCQTRILKSKESRLRDWNGKTMIALCAIGYYLKSKAPRLRDWNLDRRLSRFQRRTWNQKNLDYEIETWKSSCSIVGKPNLKSKEPRLRDWNWTALNLPVLTGAWNQKNLDYEIETYTQKLLRHDALMFPWNQKNLDYEIETTQKPLNARKDAFSLKSKAPRLRDWNVIREYCAVLHAHVLEIKSTSITRLKRYWSVGWCVRFFRLEIKSTSITRLKHGIQGLASVVTRGLEIKSTSITRLKRDRGQHQLTEKSILKSKAPRLRDWNLFGIVDHSIARLTWNQKYLDYEIETQICLCGVGMPPQLEIKSISITRLKQ